MAEIRRLWLEHDPQMVIAWQQLLEQTGLMQTESVDYTIGVIEGNQLLATGSYQANILKCLAVAPTAQSEQWLTKIVSQLLSELHAQGIYHTFVYTKPVNESIFRTLGYQPVLATASILFMEQGSPNFHDYQQLLHQKKVGKQGSAIVMNANPFTKGHQYLIEQAAKVSQHVYLFVLSEDCSMFSTADRLAMVQLGIAAYDNVTVLPTNDYAVSSATFPTYFLKAQAPLTLAKVQARLDATLFKEKIAPILGITQRFVGEEPDSAVTAVYNQAMTEVFGDQLAVVILPRLTIGGEVISASKVRQAIQANDWALVQAYVPKTSFDYLVKQI